jgi:hypothetical protein
MPEQFDGIVSIAATPGGPAVITLNGATGDISVGATGLDGDLVLRDSAGNPRIIFDAQNGTLVMRDANGVDAVVLDARFGLLDLGGPRNEGDLRIRDNNGTFVFNFDSTFAVLDIGGAKNEGDIRVRNNAGDVTIHLDGGSGDIKLQGADLAEDFAARTVIEPGSVVVALGVDEVAVAQEPCDRRVIGVAAGAGGLRSGLRLGTRPGVDRIPIAMAGRAYCMADATHGAIGLGDLLTTSTTHGHAMRVTDPAAAVGAVFGKALARLENGKGLIPVLLALR